MYGSTRRRDVPNTGDLFSPQQLARLPRRRAAHSQRARKPDHEADFAFVLLTQERPPVCMPQPHRQYLWARELGRDFRADFAFPVQRVLVEVQGGIWMPSGRGAHSGGAAIEKDIEKAQYAARLGWWWVPITEKDIDSGRALEVVQRVLERCGWVPGSK